LVSDHTTHSSTESFGKLRGKPSHEITAKFLEFCGISDSRRFIHAINAMTCRLIALILMINLM
jgi:hypothetical protein